jgi:hypothetical protein
VAKKAGVKCVVEIIPSRDINGAFGIYGYMDDSRETVHRLIKLGHSDACKALAKARIGNVK